MRWGESVRYETSLGLGPLDRLDDSDNGIYWVGGNWELRRRSVAEYAQGGLTVADLSPRQKGVYDTILAQIEELTEHAQKWKPDTKGGR